MTYKIMDVVLTLKLHEKDHKEPQHLCEICSERFYTKVLHSLLSFLSSCCVFNCDWSQVILMSMVNDYVVVQHIAPKRISQFPVCLGLSMV